MLYSLYLYVWIFAFNAYLAVFLSFLFAERSRLVNKVTMLSGLGTVWIFSELALRLGVGPNPMLWFTLSEVCLMVIPFVMYMAISAVTGRNLFNTTSVGLALLCFIEVLLGVLGLYFKPEVYLGSGISESIYAIDNIFAVDTNPTWMSFMMVISNVVATAFCLKEILSYRRIDCRNLLLLNIIGYFILTTMNIYLSSSFPFDLVAGIMNGLMFMIYLRQRKILNFNQHISHKSFPILSSLTVFIFILLLNYKVWGEMEGARTTILSVIMISSICTSLITILFESLYSRFFVDRGDYILKCSASYHESLIPLLGRIDEISDLFSKTMEKVFGCSSIALFVYDSRIGRYTLRCNPGYGDLSFAEDDRLPDHAGLLHGPQSAWNILTYLGEDEGALAEDIEKRKLSVFSPLQINGRVLGFYLLGGGRIDSVDSLDREALSSFNRTTAMALEASLMMHQLERNSVTDLLTGLYDRTTVRTIVETLLKSRKDFTFLLFNIDDLRLYNTVFSLNTGNEILKGFAEALRSEADDDMILGRVSGKTFSAFVLASKDTAIEYDSRVRSAFSRSNEGKVYEDVTFSTGLVEVSGEDDNSAEWLLTAAKAAEVSAKQKGKNRLVEYTPDLESGLRGFDSGFQIGTVEAISQALDLRDHFTYDHSANVASYARGLAEAAGLSAIDCQLVYEAGLVHDIGKISIPDSILMNPGHLTDAEYEVIKTHVERGRNVITSLPHGMRMVPIARSHHERWDGTGYPEGLKGNDIPIGGRCLAIADTFDAMTSQRVYRKAFTVDEALEEILRVSGSQLDPELGPLFVELVRSGRIKPHPAG